MNRVESGSKAGIVYIERSAPVAIDRVRSLPVSLLPVEHLQLRSNVNHSLRVRGVDSIAAAKAFILDPRIAGFPHAAELAEAVCQLVACGSTDEVDWGRYWQARRHQYHHFCAQLSGLDRLNQQARKTPVDRDLLGLAGRALVNMGYLDLGSVVDALRQGIAIPPTLGAKKIHDFYGRLLALEMQIDGNGDLSGFAAKDEGLEKEIEVSLRGDLAECVRRLPVDVLNVGVKCCLLSGGGYRTIGELVDVDPAILLRIPSVGKRTVTLALERASMLGAAVVDDEVNWTEYCTEAGLPLVPRDPPLNGHALIAGLSDIFTEIAAHLVDPIERDIIASRLLRRTGETLEEIAARHPRDDGRPVTRERVRQIESRLLKELAGALVHGRDLGLGICFHPDFVKWWTLAASEFSGTDELLLDDFLQRLAMRWDVSVEELTSELPIIYSIVTGDARLPSEFRLAARLNPVLSGLSNSTAAIALARMRLGGRNFRFCEKRGLATLGDLVVAARRGQCPTDLLDHLDLISGCIEDRELSWPKYSASLDCPLIPRESPGSAEDFVQEFCATIRAMLNLDPPSLRSAEIFWWRTRVSERSRPTLEQIALRCETHGSSIKREETILLERLADVLVNQRRAECPYWIDQRWLEFFDTVREIFGFWGHSYEGFSTALSVRWGMSAHQLEIALPAMWAILTGYPKGRRRAVDAEAEQIVARAPSRIRLKGFRQVH